MKTLAAIPCYGVGIAIGSVVLKARKYADDVVVVDDGSEDDAIEVVRAGVVRAGVVRAAGATLTHKEGHTPLHNGICNRLYGGAAVQMGRSSISTNGIRPPIGLGG